MIRYKTILGGLVGAVVVIAATISCSGAIGSQYDPMDDQQQLSGFVETVLDQIYSLGISLDLKLPSATADGAIEYRLEPAVPGLSFDSGTRVLSGTPTTIGAHSMQYTARSTANGRSATLTFSLRVIEIGKTKETATEIRQGAPIRGRFASSYDIHYFKVDVPSTVDLYAATDLQLSNYRSNLHVVTIETDEHDENDDDYIDSVENAAPGTYYITVQLPDPRGSVRFDYAVAVWLLGSENDTFDIDVRYSGGVRPSSAGRRVFQRAVDYLERAFGENHNTKRYIVTTSRRIGCGLEYPSFGDYVDDIVIHVFIKDIEAFAQGGPCRFRREPSLVPYSGRVTWDPESHFGEDSYMTMIHEIVHMLGFNDGVWERLGYLNRDSSDPHFSGPKAIEAFNEAGGASYSGAKVPLEDDAHWRRSVFVGEVMASPYLRGGGASVLSKITLALFDDIGYRVNYSVAQPFRILPAGSRVEQDAMQYERK